MISKNEIREHSSDAATRIKIISEKRKSVDKSVEKVRAEVTTCFEEIINCLKIREKQLLRQIDAVHNQQLSIVQSNWELVCSALSINVNFNDEYNDLKQLIDKFGKIELSDNDTIVVKNTDPYRVEEYEDINNEHINFDKSLKIIERNNDDLIELCDSPNTDKKIINSKNASVISINSFPSSSNNSSPSVSFDQMTNNLYMNSSLQQENMKETQNSNCPLLCSPLTNVSSELKEYELQRLDISDSSSSHLCSNEANINTLSNKIDDDKPKICTIDEEEKTSSKSSTGHIYSKTNDFSNGEKNIDCSNNNEKQTSNDEHPKQIQQWLQQILVETETEPPLPLSEIEQFAEISKARYRGFEFSLET